MAIGLTVEYIASYLGEVIFHAKWWDYSDAFLNVHGRICLFYAVIWGLLAVILIRYMNPKVNKLVDKTKNIANIKLLKCLMIFVMVFMIFDSIITAYALKDFVGRIASEYHLNVYENENKNRKEQVNQWASFFSNEKMLKIFPNIGITTADGKFIYVGSILSNVKNYYFKFE